jgi:hypothetical protein
MWRRVIWPIDSPRAQVPVLSFVAWVLFSSMLGLLFYPEDRSRKFLRQVGKHPPQLPWLHGVTFQKTGIFLIWLFLLFIIFLLLLTLLYFENCVLCIFRNHATAYAVCSFILMWLVPSHHSSTLVPFLLICSSTI